MRRLRHPRFRETAGRRPARVLGPREGLFVSDYDVRGGDRPVLAWILT